MAVKKKERIRVRPAPRKKKSEKRGPLTDVLSGSDLRLSPLLPSACYAGYPSSMVTVWGVLK